MLDGATDGARLDQLHRVVVPQNADVACDSVQGRLHVVGEFLGAQWIVGLDVEEQQAPAQRVLEQEETLLGAEK